MSNACLSRLAQSNLLFICLLLMINLTREAPAEEGRGASAHRVKTSQDIPARLDSLIDRHLARISDDSIAASIRQLADFGTRFMLAANHRSIAGWIAERFQSLGTYDVVLDSFQNTLEFPLQSGAMRTTWQYNVLASLEGSVTSDTVLVLGAHYDDYILGPGSDPYTYAPGANNNASGVAVCLEVARVMAQEQFRPRQTIIFAAFGSEEFMTMLADGKTGSEHFVSELTSSGRHVAMMIDNNQVSCRPSAHDWQIDFQNCPGSERITELGHALADRYTQLVPADTNDHINYSDVYYFWSQGYPAIFFEEYHFCPHVFTAEDVPGNHDAGYCAEVARLSLAMLVYESY